MSRSALGSFATGSSQWQVRSCRLRPKAEVNSEHRQANIPPKRNRRELICFSPYRARNLVERFFNKIKQCRRIATRYDKLAANYLAFIKPAAIRIWLQANESAP